MVVAVLLWKRPGRAASVYRALLFLPVVLAPVASAMSWQFVLNPIGGVASQTLAALHLGPVNWLGDPATALPTIAVITAQKVIGLNVLLYGAALDGLDRDCLDAARIDGAAEWQVTWHIAVQQLWSTTALLASVCVILAGSWAFTNVAVLTQGGPSGSTDNVSYRLYAYGFTFFETGLASAGAVVLMLLLAVLVGLPLILRRERADR